jgi:NAD(P)H-hydrate epimerase
VNIQEFTKDNLKELYRPPFDSHKGQNGRLLVIGGSKLFHSSIFWAADIASKIVDLVHFASPVNENNEAVRTKIKEGFWSGIAIDWGKINEYIEEDDCVVIGPGMPREDGLMEGEQITASIVNELLTKYPNKKWVVDGGALQEVDPGLLNENMIITPHAGELMRLVDRTQNAKLKTQNYNEKLKTITNSDSDLNDFVNLLRELRDELKGVTILVKGVRSVVVGKEKEYVISGGNEGLTKGGTGDVLAGLTGALYCKNSPELSAAAASLFSKKAAEKLYEKVGPYYSTGDTIPTIPEVMKELMGY